MGKELVAYLQFNGMLAVQCVRETILMANPDLLVSKFIRQEALSFVKGLESTEGIAYALGQGPGGSGFPFAAYLKEPGVKYLSWRSLDVLSEDMILTLTL